jgi:hypothetical protein
MGLPFGFPSRAQPFLWHLIGVGYMASGMDTRKRHDLEQEDELRVRSAAGTNRTCGNYARSVLELTYFFIFKFSKSRSR